MLLMIVSFFLTSIALADGRPNSKENHNDPGYLGPPTEVPNPITLDAQIKKFFQEIFILPWETINPKQDFQPDASERN